MDHIWALRVTRLSQSASGQRNYPAPPSRWEVFRYDKPKAGQRAQHSHGLVPRPQRPRPDNSPKIGWSVAAKISLASGILWWLVKWVVAAILAGAGIWGGVTWAIILRETEWRWIAMAIAVEAVILAAAIVTPKLRPKMLVVAGVAVVMTAIAVAFLLPRTWCFGYSWTGGPPYDCHGFPLWGRILVAGLGLVVGLTLASFAREKPDRGGAGGMLRDTD
jgi:hypothetical protein